MRHIIPISGKDSLTTALVVIGEREREKQESDLEFIYNDTGAELPETYEWLSKVESQLGIKITHIGKDLTGLIENTGMLPSAKARYCTRQAKIEPMIKFLKGDECNVYFGIRADENRIGFQNGQAENITPIYPLKEKGINLYMVYAILEKQNLLPPTFFWKEIHTEVVNRVGIEIVSSLKKWNFDALFSWRSRPNCYFCFYQRIYEWVGLLEHYPNLFEKAVILEESNGQEGGDDIIEFMALFGREFKTGEKGSFNWHENLPLRKIAEKKEHYKEMRVRAIVDILRKMQQQSIFEKDEIELSGTSCGMFCGK